MVNLLWLQSGGCGGCTMSLLSAQHPHLMQQLEAAQIKLLWHPSLSEQGTHYVLDLIADIRSGKQVLDILCIEGSLLRGPGKTGRCHMFSGLDTPFIEVVQALAQQAKYVVSVGSCAAFGGVTAAGGNPTDACGLQYEGEMEGGLLGKQFVSSKGLPVVNIAGCPTHPDWVLITLKMIAQKQFQKEDLDELARPVFYTQHLVHHGCSRNEYYEYKASAEKPSDLGCLMENMGCLGTQARADCNLRHWNGSGSCIKGGYACINCTAPEFEEPRKTFLQTPKVAGIPVGLPIDMPKAWFIALSTLSKSATPKRLKQGAVSDQTVIPKDEKDSDG